MPPAAASLKNLFAPCHLNIFDNIVGFSCPGAPLIKGWAASIPLGASGKCNAVDSGAYYTARYFSKIAALSLLPLYSLQR